MQLRHRLGQQPGFPGGRHCGILRDFEVRDFKIIVKSLLFAFLVIYKKLFWHKN